MFDRARASRGRWTLDEFKGWFNNEYPSFKRAGKFFVMYIFYALYMVYEERLRNDSDSTAPSWDPPYLAAPCSDPKGSVVDAVFAKAERKRNA